MPSECTASVIATTSARADINLDGRVTTFSVPLGHLLRCYLLGIEAILPNPEYRFALSAGPTHLDRLNEECRVVFADFPSLFMFHFHKVEPLSSALCVRLSVRAGCPVFAVSVPACSISYNVSSAEGFGDEANQ